MGSSGWMEVRKTMIDPFLTYAVAEFNAAGASLRFADRIRERFQDASEEAIAAARELCGRIALAAYEMLESRGGNVPREQLHAELSRRFPMIGREALDAATSRAFFE